VLSQQGEVDGAPRALSSATPGFYSVDPIPFTGHRAGRVKMPGSEAWKAFDRITASMAVVAGGCRFRSVSPITLTQLALIGDQRGRETGRP
jgi:hypothetical protein